ncbi:adenylate/guanylate cyclase domain-containing protein [Aeoliella sp. SH292]|uniref:adenylate/guanylate cyclase domain-containing protein n=1 Tax=Aeoliella sp. SH292 TaxID=3454464 RepID=UPI003F9C25C8
MIDIAIYNSDQHTQTRHAGLVAVVSTPEGWRTVEPPDLPASAGRIECIPSASGYTLTIDYPHARFARTLEPLPRGMRIRLAGRAILQVGDSFLEFIDPRSALAKEPPLEGLSSDEFGKRRDTQTNGPAPATVARWFEALGTLHRWPANCREFYNSAARFVVDPVGLDGAMVLRRSDSGDWNIVASHLPYPELGVAYLRELVDQAASERRTLFQSLNDQGHAVVLSPLTTASGDVVGMVYGYRSTHSTNGRRGVRYLEAHLVELLAQSVSCGLSRLDADADAARQRVTLEQRFSPTVAAEIELDTHKLEASEREVTVMFADLRGFSAICTQLSASDTYQMLGDVLDTLTNIVLAHGGTLIDYYGDGLAAMWNAPLDQPRHVPLACQTALAMQEALASLSDRWEPLLAAPLALGVGIHTGPAQVGNIGSSRQHKYGPRGTTVNLASRLEQATKRVEAPIVVTREVASQLGGDAIVYRLCQAQLAGIEQPIDLFAQLPSNTNAVTLAAIPQYEAALAAFEEGNLDAAKGLLEAIEPAAELPTQFLLSEIRREHHRRLGRRAGDERTTGDSQVISLSAK